MTSNGKHSEYEMVPMTTYVLVFIALMILLVATVWVATLPWDKMHATAWSVVIALVIATIKAALVILFFMHVKISNRLTQTFVVAAFIWLGILFVFSFTDYLTRAWMPSSSGWVGHSTWVHDPYPTPQIMPPEIHAQRPQVQSAAQ